MPQNKRMQLTKLRAAPVLQAEVPPCAPAGGMDGGTASQLIRSVGRTGGGIMRPAAAVVVLLHLCLAVQGEGGELYRFGRDADRLAPDEMVAIRTAVEARGEPWAILTWHSQVLPEVRYADVFLPPTVATQEYRRGPFVHLECRPLDGEALCQSWAHRSELGVYFQLFESSRVPDRMTVLSEVDRPARVRGTFSDDDLVSLIKYIRSGPGPLLPPGHFPARVTRGIPIQDIEQQEDGSVWVRLTVDGIGGETATVVRTDGGWQIAHLVHWVA
jgi:hypothetical protein